MPSLLIRDIPEKVYKQLRAQAEQHRRSLAKEALVVLEERLSPYDVPKIDWSRFPTVPLRGRPGLSPEAIRAAIKEGRE
jgi:hypothetical protein